MSWIDSIKEAIGVSVQELSRAAANRILWASFIHGVIRCQSRLNDT